MTEYTVNLTGNIDKKATGDAAAVRALRAEVKGLQADLKAVGGMQSILRGAGAARAGAGSSRGGVFGPTTDGWSRAQGAADRYARAMGKAQSQAIAMDQRRAALAQRQAARAAAQEAREEQQFSAYRLRLNRKEEAEKAREAKRAAAAAEKAAHKSYYGGEKSLSGLFGKRADHKMSNFATGAADAILDAPGRIVSGALGGIGAAVVGTASMAFNFGKAAVAAQAMREESVEGFTAIFGSSKKANELFDAARDAAKMTKFDTKDVVKDFNTLAAGGFAADDIEKVYWSSADVGSARGAGRQERYIQALTKINASPQAGFGNLQQAAMAGPGLGNVYAQLTERMNLKQTMTRKGWMQLFRDGKVSSKMAMESIIGATTALYDKKTGKPGEYAQAQGDKTWTGLLSNIANGLGDVLNMKLPANHAMYKFKELLAKIGDSQTGLFSGQKSAVGRRFEKLVGNLMEDVFMPFGGAAVDKSDSIIQKLLGYAEDLERRFRKIMMEITTGTNEFLNGAKGSFMGFAADIGVAIGKGIYEGMRDKLPGHELTKEEAQAHIDTTEKNGSFWDLWTGKGPGGFREDVPSYADGGVVPGAPGQEMLAKVHGGEIISGLNGQFLGAMGGGGGATFSGDIIINMPDMPGATASELAQTGGQMLATAAQRQMDAGMRLRLASGGL